jgi:hypothetical protein
MTRTKYICPACRDRRGKKVNLVVDRENPKPHCPDCDFECRRYGNTMIDNKEDRRGNHFHAGAWETF